MNAIFALEKLRARGCIVHYIKPLWLIQEEEILKSELADTSAANNAGKFGEALNWRVLSISIQTHFGDGYLN